MVRRKQVVTQTRVSQTTVRVPLIVQYVDSL